MIKVSLEFLSWLSDVLEIEGSGNSLRFEMNVEKGCTVKQLLLQMAAVYPRLGQSVYDANLHKLNEKVCVFCNGRQLELQEGLMTRLKDRDSLVFVPVIQGG